MSIANDPRLLSEMLESKACAIPTPASRRYQLYEYAKRAKKLEGKIADLLGIIIDAAIQAETRPTIEDRKQKAVEELQAHLLEAEAEWWGRLGQIELFNDLCFKSMALMTDEDIEKITEEISHLAWKMHG